MNLRAIVALVFAGVAMAFFAPSASATTAPAPYPPPTCATISVSSTTVNVGETITVTGSSFNPNSAVKLILTPNSGASGFTNLLDTTFTLKTVTTDAQGNFSTTVVMPDATTGKGIFILTATSGFSTSTVCPADPVVQLTLSAAGVNNGSGGGTNNNPGGTAFTGVNIGLMLLAAAALIGSGLLLNSRKGRAQRVRASRY